MLRSIAVRIRIYEFDIQLNIVECKNICQRLCTCFMGVRIKEGTINLRNTKTNNLLNIQTLNKHNVHKKCVESENRRYPIVR